MDTHICDVCQLKVESAMQKETQLQQGCIQRSGLCSKSCFPILCIFWIAWKLQEEMEKVQNYVWYR